MKVVIALIIAILAVLVTYRVTATYRRARWDPNNPRIGNHSVRALAGNNFAWNPATWSDARAYAAFWGRADMAEKLRTLGVGADCRYQRTVVVHYRCSDVPFGTGKDFAKEYPMLPKAYYQFAARTVNATDIDRVLVINCAKHNAHSLAHRCGDYARAIAGWFADALPSIPVDVELSCDSQQDDLGKMLGAHTLVSTGGSFSFVPGITKGRRFVSPYLGGVMSPYHDDLHELVHWTMWPKLQTVHVDDHATFDYSAAG